MVTIPTMENLNRAYTLGVRAKEVAKVAEKNGFDLVFEFSYGVHNSWCCAILQRGLKEIKKFATLDLFDGNNYDIMVLALDDMESMVKSYSEKEIIAKEIENLGHEIIKLKEKLINA